MDVQSGVDGSHDVVAGSTHVVGRGDVCGQEEFLRVPDDHHDALASSNSETAGRVPKIAQNAPRKRIKMGLAEILLN